MKNNVKNKKGITLIALVITIIVLLILAGISISMISSQDGILNKAVTAKETTKKAANEEEVKLAIQAAMMNENGEIDYSNISGATLDPKAVEKVIKYNGNNYLISEDGDVKQVAWYVSKNNEEKYVVTNGTKEILLGATVNYNPLSGIDLEKEEQKKLVEVNASDDKTGITTENSDGQEFKIENNEEQKLIWKVLGTDEDGNILIIPNTNIKTSDGTDYQKLQLSGKKGAQYGAELINTICGIYGHGIGAKSARSLKVEDIDKITKFDKTTSAQDEIYGYGHKVTYTKRDGVIYYKWNEEEKSSTYETFKYLKGNEWKTLEDDESVTLESTRYSYELTEANLGNVYELITNDTSSNSYWLGSSYVRTNDGNAYFGVRSVYRSYVEVEGVFHSGGLLQKPSLGFRPVVSLEPDIELVPIKSDGSYNISIK